MKRVIHTTHKIIHVKLTIITIVLLPFAVFALLTSKTELLGLRTFVVLTGSMQPTVPQGSIIITQSKPSYSVGDVVAFQKDQVTITHRIVDIKDNKFVTRGDANNTNDDGTIVQKDITGKTLFYLPYIGSFILFMKTIPGFVALVIIPGLLFILFEMLKIKSEIEKEFEKKYAKRILTTESSLS